MAIIGAEPEFRMKSPTNSSDRPKPYTCSEHAVYYSLLKASTNYSDLFSLASPCKYSSSFGFAVDISRQTGLPGMADEVHILLRGREVLSLLIL